MLGLEWYVVTQAFQSLKPSWLCSVPLGESPSWCDTPRSQVLQAGLCCGTGFGR